MLSAYCFQLKKKSKTYSHFVKIGWPFFPWGQQHCHKDGDDKKGKDCSNHSPCYSNRRCLLKWQICNVTAQIIPLRSSHTFNTQISYFSVALRNVSSFHDQTESCVLHQHSYSIGSGNPIKKKKVELREHLNH